MAIASRTSMLFNSTSDDIYVMAVQKYWTFNLMARCSVLAIVVMQVPYQYCIILWLIKPQIEWIHVLCLLQSTTNLCIEFPNRYDLSQRYPVRNTLISAFLCISTEKWGSIQSGVPTWVFEIQYLICSPLSVELRSAHEAWFRVMIVAIHG